jgi:hypothetical protein
MPPLAAAETPGKFAFNESFDNWGMVVAGVLVTVLWLLFRKMLELSEKKQGEQRGKK